MGTIGKQKRVEGYIILAILEHMVKPGEAVLVNKRM
jgi:hypothetical protein